MMGLVDHTPEGLRAPDLEAAVAAHRTLDQVVRWGVARGHVVTRVVHQDEYTLDVVLPIGDGLFLVYDTT